MEDVDSAMREGKLGAVTSSEVDNGPQASGTPGGDPELQSVTVTVQGDDEADAEGKLRDAMPGAESIEVGG